MVFLGCFYLLISLPEVCVADAGVAIDKQCGNTGFFDLLSISMAIIEIKTFNFMA